MSNGSNGLLRSYADLSSSRRDEIDALLAANPWRPLVDVAEPARKTPQELAFASPADFLFYGGAAGGGKTDLLIGLALGAHQRSILFRREAKQLRAVTDRVRQILNTRSGFNSQQNRWRLPDGRLLDLGGVKDAGQFSALIGISYSWGW